MWREKSLIFERDQRYHILQKDDAEIGAIRPLIIEDLYDDVAGLSLPDSVPPVIRHQFDLARNAYLYSWFEYELTMLAEAHAFSVVEMAVKHRTTIANQGGTAPNGLRAALRHAVRQGWLTETDFLYQSRGQQMSLIDDLVYMRNALAHGEPHLSPELSVMVMRHCRDIISKLFPEGT